jgi:hypothetical protein
MKYVYFIVEGQHDTAAIGRVLKENHFKIVSQEVDLDKFWDRMIPKSYPIKGELLKRPPHPTFYQRDDFSIAIHTSGSKTEMVNTLSVNLQNLDFIKLHGIGLFIDADDKDPRNCCMKLQEDINKSSILDDDIKPLFSSILPGRVHLTGTVKTGIYVFPDNVSPGNLENVLLLCAKSCYSDLLESAKQYVGSINISYKKEWTGSSENKVLVGCIANVLKPGKANQVSIQENDWLCNKNLHIESVAKLYSFINDFVS